MRHAGSNQIEEYRHRIGKDAFRLNKINAEMIYFLDKNGHLENIFDGIPEYKDRLFRALASNDHTQRLAYGKDLMRDLWEIELGLGSYPFADILAEFEFGGKFFRGYRDHVVHQLKVYLLGLYLFFGCERIRSAFAKSFKLSDFLMAWKVAALAHDHGYVFETPEGETSQWVVNMVLPAFDFCVGHPVSSLSETVRKRNLARTNDPTLKKLLHLLRNRGITKTKEDRIQSTIEVIRPSVTSVTDLIDFRGANLFNALNAAALHAKLCEPNTNGLQAYYDFAFKYDPSNGRQRFRDHGITSALFLLLQSHFHLYYAQKLKEVKRVRWEAMGLSSENIRLVMGISKLFKKAHLNISKAAEAIALHNMECNLWAGNKQLMDISEKDAKLTLQDFVIPHTTLPLAFLLRFVDTLQDWDRPSFTAMSSHEARKYQSDHDMSITLGDNIINISFPNKSAFPVDPFKRLVEELKKAFDPALIDDLLIEVVWRALGVCEATREAEEIETEVSRKSPYITADKLKELIAFGKKADHFEYCAFLDTQDDECLLRLVRHLVALANTGGGYFVIGIREKDFSITGITDKTYIHEKRKLNDLFSLFWSSPIEYHHGLQKLVVKTHEARESRNFSVFYVQKGNRLVWLTKEGVTKKKSQSYFSKDEIPVRQNGTTVSANRAYLLDRFREAKLYDDQEMIDSILSLGKLGKFPADISEVSVLPGALPNPDFVKFIGREDELKETLDFLQSAKMYTLTIDGVGGSGKSALALEVAWNVKFGSYRRTSGKLRLDYPFEAVVWVSAKTCLLTDKGIVPRLSSALTLDILLDEIADAMEFSELKKEDFDKKKAGVLEIMHIFMCLIVIDNLETIPDSHKEEIINFVEKEVPPPSKVLFTTRSKFHKGYSVRVMELNPEDAMVLAKDVAIEFGNLRLARNDNLIKNVVLRTGRIPLGIRWVISRMSLGFGDTRSTDEILDDKTLVRFCFEETFKHLKAEEKKILFAVAICDFTPKIDNVEFLTQISRDQLTEGLERLEAFSLLKNIGGQLHLLPLTKDYSLFELDQDLSLKALLRLRLGKLYQFDESVADNLPVNERMAMKLFKEAAFKDSQGDLDGTRRCLENALELVRLPVILRALGEVHERLDNQNDAIKYFQEYLKQKTDDKVMLEKIGFHYKRQEDFQKSLSYFKRALKIDPNDKTLWYYQGQVEKSLIYKYGINSPVGETHRVEAIKSFKRAIRESPKNTQEKHYNSINFFQIAKCHLLKNETKKAIEACSKGLIENSENIQLRVLARELGILDTW